MSKSMREDFTPTNGVTLMLEACEKIAAAVGVDVTWKIIGDIPDADMRPELFQQGMRELIGVIGAMSAGAKVNPMTLLKGVPRGPNNPS